MRNQEAFIPPTLPRYHTRHLHRRERPTCSKSPEGRQRPTTASQPNQTRRRLLLLPLLPFLHMTTRPSTAATLPETVAPILMCRKIMQPVARYIEEGAWDKGRTNVNYCTRVLAIRRNMRDGASFLEDDGFYDAMDIMGELDNAMTQLDASLYTPLFIPADEGISSEQKIYQTQARGFYAQAINLLEGYIRLIPEPLLNDARKRASKAVYEIRFEDE